jgi:gluconolactonase
MGARVYAFNPDSGAVCVVADNFVMPNGIAFSPDFGTLYVTDTGDKDVSDPPPRQREVA